MALGDFGPAYIEPCLIERSESDLFDTFDFGEYYYPSLDSPDYPQLCLVYNGKVLNVQSDLVHASLSGISIKHYYGKCYEEIVKEEGHEAENYDYGEEEMDDLDWFGNDEDVIKSLQEGKFEVSKESTEDDSFEYREDSVTKEEGQPICTLPRINRRNSFWNIHRPELCKLTWGQKYVSSATVIDHLHEHLISHGELCEGFHTEEERKYLLNKEMDEYVRLKVLACPRELPPDEPLLKFVEDEVKINPKCKYKGRSMGIKQNRYFPIKNDEEIEGRHIRRSKAEFCLTIGKYISTPLFIPSIPEIEKPYITPEIRSSAEEASEFFFYNWFLYGEEPLEDSGETNSRSCMGTETDSSTEPCPASILDDFCRGVGKVDFSDLRWNPDL